MLYRIPAEGIPEGVVGGSMLASCVLISDLWYKRCRTRIAASSDGHVQKNNLSLNRILPTLFTLRNEESKIIAVMSSNADDVLYGYLPEGADAMNLCVATILGWQRRTQYFQILWERIATRRGFRYSCHDKRQH